MSELDKLLKKRKEEEEKLKGAAEFRRVAEISRQKKSTNNGSELERLLENRKKEDNKETIITATAGKQTPIKTTITNKPSGVSVNAAPVSVGTEKSGRQAQLEDSRRRTQEIQWDREAEAKRKEKTDLTDRSNAVEYLQKASGIAPKEESNVKAYENNYSDAAVKNAQDRSAELKEMAAKLQEEIKYSENRHSAYFSNKLYDRAEKEKNHKRDLESQLANINGQLKYYDKVMGNTTVQRVGNALKGIGATGAAAIGVLGETVETAAKDSIENLRNNELQNEMWEEQQRLNSLGMSAPERAAEMRKFREENADKFVKTAVDPNSRAMQNYRNAMTYTEKATEGLEGGAKVLADTAISVADNAMLMPLAMISPTLPLALMSVKAAAGKAYELNERGIASGESIFRAIASGGIEAVTEKIPLDNLVDMVKKGGKGFIREMLEQAGLEGTEEGISYIGNYIVDRAAKDPEATFSLQELATSILQGGLSGMFFGVGGGVTNALTGNTQERVNPTAEHYKGTQAVVGQNGVYQDYEGIKNASGNENKVKEPTTYTTDDGKNEDALRTQQRKTAMKMVNAKNGQSQQIYRQIMANYGFGKTMNKIDAAAKRAGSEVVYYASDDNSEGYYEDGKIYFNVNRITGTEKDFWRVFKHELTHRLEGTDAYSMLMNETAGVYLFGDFLVKYGYSKTDESGNTVADITVLENEIRDLYRKNGVELTEQKLQNEMIARFVEESELFTNEESIRRLVEGSPTVAHRIYYWIKDMVRKFRGTEYEKDLINAERMYLKAIEQAGRGQGNKGEVRENLIVQGPKGKYVKESRDINLGEDSEKWEDEFKTFFINNILKNGDVKITADDGEILTINGRSEWKLRGRDDVESKKEGESKRKQTDDEYKRKLKAAAHIDELAQISKQRNKEPIPDKKDHIFARDGFNYRTAYFEDKEGNRYRLNVSVGKNGDVQTVYNINKIVPRKRKSTTNVAGPSSQKGGAQNNGGTTNNVSQWQKNNNHEIGNNLGELLKKAGLEVNDAEESREYSFKRDNDESGNHKSTQLDIILNNNAADDGYHTWIRSADDILTAEEAFDEDEFGGTPDFTYEDAQKALESGRIVVYSSKPIKQGIFVSPSKMEALSYAGNGKVYSKTVPLDSVAWIDDIQGQYADANEREYSFARDEKNTDDDQEKTKIRLNMPENERAEILKNAKLKLVEYGKNGLIDEMSMKQIEETFGKEKREAIKSIARRYGRTGKKYYNNNVELEFNFSESSLSKSINVQSKNKKFETMAKMFSVFDEIVNNAILVERHNDKYIGTIREDKQLKEMCVLLGGFIEGDKITPVKLEIKEFDERAIQENKLYVVVTLEDVITNKKEAFSEIPNDEINHTSIISPASTINISDLVAKINVNDGELLKYLPDEMLNEAQIKSKNIAIEKEEKKISDLKNGIRKEYSFRRDGIENANTPSLNAKADRKLKYAANSLMEKFKGDMGISRFRNSREMGSIVRNFAKDCAEKGYVDSAEADRVFEELFERGMVENREFYEQYKDVAAKIRGTQLYDGTLGSEAPELRRTYYGNIHLVTNPRALKIDSFYQELCGMYPELFSEDIAEASDQLIRMKEVLDSIRVSEESVRYAYDNMEEAKALARGSFDSSLRQFEEELNDVMIYASQKEEEKKDQQERKELAEFVKDDVATAKSMYEKRRSAKEEYNKLAEKELIGEREKAVMDQLWKKEITMEQIPKGVNKNGVEKVYKAYRTWKDQDAVIKMYKKSVKEEYAEEARSAIANSDRWKDKSAGWKYSTEIMERNFEDITKELGKETGNKRRSLDAKDINETYFKAIHHNEAESTRMKNEYTERIKKLELGTKEKYRVSIRDDVTGFPKAVDVSESSLVQLFGEKMITEAELKAVGADVAKIKHAVSEFRSIYNELIDKTNVVLVRNGYEPVPKRKDYFPHFTEAKPDTMLGKMASFAGINIVRDELPTDIAGLTHTFRPGKRWVGNFLQRVGKSTDYDALKGFDRYIDSVSDVIWHTDDIQRLRALENELRYKYSDSGTKERLDTIRNDDSLTPEEKQSKTEDILKNQQLSHLPNLVTALRNYTDSLAGKKSIGDRTWEQFLGRGMYNTIKSVENKISANMVALNPGSWLTNFIPITQAMGEVRTDAMLNALWDTVKRQSKTDGFAERSDFIVNRKGADAVSRSKAEKAQEFLTKPFKAIDEFTSEVVTRALYYDHMRTSKDDIEALEYANDRAARIMADRSKGAMPTVFNNKNPVSKLFTMFQVEVNNQYRYMFKDVPSDLKEKGLGMIAMAMFKMWLGAWLYNYLYEEATGRKAAFDPIDLMMTAGKDIMSEDKTLSAALIDTGKNVLEEVPFVGGILGGGRIPISSALPDVENVVTAGAGLISGDMDSRKALTTLAKEAAKPGLYILPPVGGGQAKKTLESIGVLAKGGEYTYENDGDPKLRYAVEDPSVWDIGKAVVFGKSSLPGYKEYMARGFTALSAEQTKNYHKAVEAGISYPKYMEALTVTRGLESDKDAKGNSIGAGTKAEKQGKGKSLSMKKKEAIDTIEDLDKKQREVLYEAMGVSKEVW